MKLAYLKEMAVRNPSGFELSQDDWDDEVKLFSSAENLKQINSDKFIRVHDAGDNKVYTLWVGSQIVSYVKIAKITIADKQLNSILFVASDPSKNQMGYATELVWELHLTLDEDIYIGGAFSETGESLVKGLSKMYSKIRNEFPPLINSVTGDKEPFDFEKLMSKPKLGLILEDCCFFEAFKETSSKRFWLNDNVDLKGCP